MRHHVLAELVVDHAGVGARVLLGDPGDLEASVRELPDALAPGRDWLSAHLPVELRGGGPDCDAGEAHVLLCHRHEGPVEGGDLGRDAAGGREGRLRDRRRGN